MCSVLFLVTLILFNLCCMSSLVELNLCCTSMNKNNAIIVSFFSVVRNSAFNLGSDVNLTCSDKTWNVTMFVIWNIKVKYKDCKIAFNSDGRSDDSCNDGKSLQNTSSSQSYLHIPNFSNDDVGIYKCEFIYKGGSENYEINVAIKGKINENKSTCSQ